MARSAKEELQDLLNSGQVQPVADNKFGKRVRNVDQDPMDVNELITKLWKLHWFKVVILKSSS